MRRISSAVVLLFIAAGFAACGDSNPASPSNPNAVTIEGSVVASSGSEGNASSSGSTTRSLSAATAPAGLRVSVVGSNISATVDGAGKFSLKNVPPGNAELRFSTDAMNATITLTDLQTGQTVTIAVSLAGSTASLESERRASGSEVQLEGKVESLPPTTATGSFRVAGQLVTTNDATRFYLRGADSNFAALALGQRVHIKGQTSGTSLLASVVNIQNTNTDTGQNANGVMSGFSGTRSSFQFTVNGQLIKGDSQTEFYGNSQFLELADGQRVEVKVSQRDGFLYATRIHVSAAETDFSGVITAKTGTSPDLTLTIAGKTVKTSDATDVRRKGDEQDPSVLYVNQTVEVTGVLLPDGTVIARKIHIVADAAGGTFEMEGSIGGMSGSCQVLTFSVSGYTIKTNAATTFTPSCGSLSNGNKVLVKGTVQADLSVLATSVAKQ